MSDQKKNSQAQPDSGAAQNKQPVQERAGGGPAITKGTLKTAKRLLGYVTKTYKVQFIVVLFCILVKITDRQRLHMLEHLISHTL